MIRCKTYLGGLLHRTPDECRVEIERALVMFGGNVTKSAMWLTVSRPFLWYCMRKLTMNKRPAEHREAWKRRFRIERKV